MRKGIHPKYRAVVFQDMASDLKFLTRSTIKTSNTIKWTDGKEYPLATTEISSASHPFYTGTVRVMDTEGRIEKFRKKYSKKS